jgi:hypothetical protein
VHGKKISLLAYYYNYYNVFKKWDTEQPKSYAQILFNMVNYKHLLTGDYKPKKLFNIMNYTSLRIYEKNNQKRFYINSDVAARITSYIDVSDKIIKE